MQGLLCRIVSVAWQGKAREGPPPSHIGIPQTLLPGHSELIIGNFKVSRLKADGREQLISRKDKLSPGPYCLPRLQYTIVPVVCWCRMLYQKNQINTLPCHFGISLKICNYFCPRLLFHFTFVHFLAPLYCSTFH